MTNWSRIRLLGLRSSLRSARRVVRWRRQRLRDHRHLLRPGLYRFAQSAAWVRVGSSSRLRPRRARAERQIVALLLDALTGAALLRRPSGLQGDATVLYCSYRDTIALDPTSRRVTRTYVTPVPAEYTEMRRHLQNFLEAPNFHISDDRMSISEELLDVRPFREQPPSAQIEAARHIIAALTRALEQKREREARKPSKVATAVNLALLPKEITSNLSGDVLSELLKVQWVPSHGDLAVTNVCFADNHTNFPVVLDWDPRMLQPLPFWFDAVFLLLSEPLEAPNRPLADGYWSGTFDASLAELALAGGESASILTSRRRSVTACAALLNEACVAVLNEVLPGGGELRKGDLHWRTKVILSGMTLLE